MRHRKVMQASGEGWFSYPSCAIFALLAILFGYRMTRAETDTENMALFPGSAPDRLDRPGIHLGIEASPRPLDVIGQI